MRSKLIAAFTCTTALVTAGAASAADLAARPYTKAPAYIEPLFNWTGFYVGGHIGGAWTNEQFINSTNTTLSGDLLPGQGYRQRGSGVMGGAQIGYNWQANNYVFGLEGTISGLDNHGSFVNTAFGARDDVFSWRANVLTTIVGRAGFAVNNNLFYIRGGYAGVNNRLSVSDPFRLAGEQTHWANGWTLGAGWEYAVTRNWIVGLEYNYAAFGSQTYQLAGTSGGSYTFDAKPRDIQWAVVRGSYKFDAPVIARY